MIASMTRLIRLTIDINFMECRLAVLRALRDETLAEIKRTATSPPKRDTPVGSLDVLSSKGWHVGIDLGRDYSPPQDLPMCRCAPPAWQPTGSLDQETADPPAAEPDYDPSDPPASVRREHDAIDARWDDAFAGGGHFGGAA